MNPVMWVLTSFRIFPTRGKEVSEEEQSGEGTPSERIWPTLAGPGNMVKREKQTLAPAGIKQKENLGSENENMWIEPIAGLEADAPGTSTGATAFFQTVSLRTEK